MIEIASIKRRANAFARTALAPVPLHFWQAAFPKDVVALCYHVVSDEDLPHLQLYPYKNAEQFEADVIFARSRATTYRQVADRRLEGKPLARNSILFTFDDGLTQCYDVARPILKKLGVDAVFFVTTDYLDDRETFFESTQSLCAAAIATIDAARARKILATVEGDAAGADRANFELATGRLAATRLPVADDAAIHDLYLLTFGIAEGDRRLTRLCELLAVDVATYATRTPIFMSRKQVAGLAADGFTVGAHGRKHRSLEHLSVQDLEDEIVSSCDAVRSITGQTRVPFAFPYSGLGIERTVLAGIVQRNPLVELIFDSGCLRNDPQFIVNRVFADAPTVKGTDSRALSNVPTALRNAWSVPSAWFRSR